MVLKDKPTKHSSAGLAVQFKVGDNFIFKNN